MTGKNQGPFFLFFLDGLGAAEFVNWVKKIGHSFCQTSAIEFN